MRRLLHPVHLPRRCGLYLHQPVHVAKLYVTKLHRMRRLLRPVHLPGQQPRDLHFALWSDYLRGPELHFLFGLFGAVYLSGILCCGLCPSVFEQRLHLSELRWLCGLRGHLQLPRGRRHYMQSEMPDPAMRRRPLHGVRYRVCTLCLPGPIFCTMRPFEHLYVGCAVHLWERRRRLRMPRDR
jgi:hypothetical protein